VRYLPFDNDDLNYIIQKIIHEGLHERFSMSAALSDLLHKLPMKDWARRITLSGVKTHPWFTDALTDNFAAAKRFRTCSDLHIFVIDQEIVGPMANFGRNATNLIRDLATHMFSPTSTLA
jgi:serine/threonine protein kinase